MNPPPRDRSHRSVLAATAALLTCVTATATVIAARQDNGTPPQPSGAAVADPRQIAAGSVGLALAEDGTLAAPRIVALSSPVLDVEQITSNLGGSEQRADLADRVTFRLQAEVLFAKDSAHLNDSARAHISAIARIIGRQHPAVVQISGFTDDLGSSAHGDALSRKRAGAVRTVIETQLRSSTTTFTMNGYGEAHPLASNATEAGRRQNRRVEVSFKAPQSGP